MIHFFSSLALFAVCAQSAPAAPPQQTFPSAAHSQIFNPAQDAASDLRAALLDARRSGRRVLLDVGGDWCVYCLQLEEFFRTNRDLAALRDRSFVTVHVYFGDTRQTARILAGLPPVLGIPHFYVLDDTGALLHSQHVTELREGPGYSATKIATFLKVWAIAPPLEPTLISDPLQPSR